jgi:hypothetical protein
MAASDDGREFKVRGVQKMKSLARLIASVSLVVVVGLLPGAAVKSAGPIDPTELAQATRMRSDFGFDAREETVVALLAAGVRTDRGEVLRPEEAENLRVRADLRERLDPSLQVLRSRPDEFGPHYFDQTRGKLELVVGLLDDGNADALESFNRELPRDAVVRFVQAQFSAAYLGALRDELFDALPPDPATSAFLDVSQARVILSVPKERLADATKLVGDRADAVEIRLGAATIGNTCVSRSNCVLPWRGGIYLSGCTWGFNARPTASSSVRWVLSSGHCSHIGDDRIHNGSIVNTSAGVDRNSYDLDGPTALAEAMRAPLKTDLGARNLVFISSQNLAYPITSKEATIDQEVGDGVAMSGLASLYVSGTIVTAPILHTLCRSTGDCVSIKTIKASFWTDFGDSGAPVISRTLPRAFGLNYGHEAGDNRAIYTPIDAVLTDMSARLCLNSGCT